MYTLDSCSNDMVFSADPCSNAPGQALPHHRRGGASAERWRLAAAEEGAELFLTDLQEHERMKTAADMRKISGRAVARAHAPHRRLALTLRAE
jgi:hypothetical protein